VIRRISTITLLICLGLSGSVASAKGRGTRQAAAPKTAAQPELAALLPDSDTVVTANVSRILTEIIPRLFANRQAKLDEINAQIDELKRKTGLDVRLFRDVAIGARYLPGQTTSQAKANTTKTVMLARGDFNAGGMVSAARIAAGSKMREVKAGSKTIVVVSLADLKDKAATAAGTATTGSAAGGAASKVLGRIIDDQSGEVALVALDQNTLAIGDLTLVQETLRQKKPVAVNADLISLAHRAPDSLIAVGGTMPPDLAKQAGFDNDQITKNLNSIRQAYGAVTFSADNYELLVGARTATPAAATDLRDTLEGLKLLGSFGITRIRQEELRKVAQRGLDNLKVTTTGNEVVTRLPISEADAGVLLDLWK
jgi:hypothetical protein